MNTGDKDQVDEHVLLMIGGNKMDLVLVDQLVQSNDSLLFFRVSECPSCKEAVKLLRPSKISCCLVSDHESTADILDFLKSLRRSKLHKNTPVIILADKKESDARSAVEMMHHGAQDYLVRDDLTENDLRRSIVDAIYACEFQKKLHQLAHYDQLTGLLNRSLFTDRLESAVKHCDRYSQSCSLLFIDVDNFKVVNDCYGHDTGDALLKTIANRIQKNCRSTDSAARLGGDEFAILISRVDKHKANQTAEKILEKVSEPVLINSQYLHVSLSIGVAHYPDTANTINELMEQADQAMYRAKHAGKSRYFQFSQNQKLRWERRSRLELMLPDAIKDDELRLYFEPVFNVDSKTLYSLNVVVDWLPGRYKVSQEELLEMIDRLGLFERYYCWLIDSAVAELSQWQQKYSKYDLCISLPIDDCSNESLLEYFQGLIKQSGIKPENIEIEITEKTLGENISQGRKFLKLIQNIGLNVSIDDYDGSYSSLDDLTQLPLDTLKIDKRYLSNIENNPQKYKTVETVTLLGHTLGLKVVATGIHDESQHALINDIGCDLMQGSYIAQFFYSLDDCFEYIESLPRLSKAAQ